MSNGNGPYSGPSGQPGCNPIFFAIIAVIILVTAAGAGISAVVKNAFAPAHHESTAQSATDVCLNTGRSATVMLGGPHGAHVSNPLVSGPHRTSSACTFIAVRLESAPYAPHARVCLERGSGSTQGGCGPWFQLENSGNAFSVLLEKVPAGSAWTLELYADYATEALPVSFTYTE